MTGLELEPRWVCSLGDSETGSAPRTRSPAISLSFRPSWAPSPTPTTPAARTARSCTGPPAYHARSNARPCDRSADAHDRVRTDRVDPDGKLTLRVNGRLHHIGIGRDHARSPVLMLVGDLNVRVIHAATGELIRELTVDPNRNYQPTGKPPGPQPKRPRTR